MTWLTFALLTFLATAEPKRIAITFDDAPNPGTFLSGEDRATHLLAGLRDAGVPRVAFFANSVRMDGEGSRRLRRYAEAGHLIANHTHSHLDLNKVSARAFLIDVVEADRRLSDLPNFTRWFRFPYLHEGQTSHKRDLVRRGLEDLGYLNAYITVNTYDWHLDVLFQRALAAGARFNAFRTTYLSTTVDAARYYDDLAFDMMKRSPAHVLLLHENDLNAFYIMELIHSLRGAGWQIISPEEAYEDPLVRYVSPNARESNPGRLGEMAIDQAIDLHPWHESCDQFFLERRVYDATSI